MTQKLNPDLPILLVDDERPWLRSLSLALERVGGLNNLITCQDSREALDILRRQPVSLVLLDLNMPYMSGQELLLAIHQTYPDIPVIVISGLNQVDTAVKCMRLGAFDYFVKTVEEDRLLAGVLRALRLRELQGENQKLKSSLLDNRLQHPDAFDDILTCSSQMQNIFRYVEAVAPSCEPILITGESGTGKELIAHAVHRVATPEGPWVTVNVAGLDDNVFADTLFGHVKGAFTGADAARPGMIEQARGGTLFLDEIGDLSLPSQIKLLRLLQEGEYHPLGSDRPKRIQARIVVATNRDLAQAQLAGTFRKDLFFRLRAHHIHLPPLHERSEDIPLLLHHFLEEAANAFGKKRPTPPDELPTLLQTHNFPGNVRELRAMVFDAVSVHNGGKLSMNNFKKAMGAPQHNNNSVHEEISGPELHFPTPLPTIERTVRLLIEEALQRANGNQSIAAGMLGISRPALNKRLKKLDDEQD